MMAGEVWSFLETEGNQLLDTAASMATEAKRTARIFGAQPAGVIFSEAPEGLVESLQPYGLEKLYCCRRDLPLEPEIVAHSIQTAAEARPPNFILFADTSLGSDVGTRVAAALRRGFVSPCTDFSTEADGPVARKAIYGGKADALVGWTTPPPYLAGVALDALETTTVAGAAAPEVVDIALSERPSGTGLEESWAVDLSQLDLAEATVVIGVGKGVRPNRMPLVKELAERIQGVVGGTRIAVYDGLIPHERQIGTTGKWLDCDLYIALGISGAPQHVMGVKSVKKIIAINAAREAPIFHFAHLGIIHDWEEVIQDLNELLKNRAGKRT
jgi:electron transfer flavoprotein alpha subunit